MQLVKAWQLELVFKKMETNISCITFFSFFLPTFNVDQRDEINYYILFAVILDAIGTSRAQFETCKVFRVVSAQSGLRTVNCVGHL